MTKSKVAQWVGLALSLVVVFLLVRSLQLDLVVQTLSQADYWWLLPAVAISLTSFVFRSQRFRLFLIPIKYFSLVRSYSYIAINYMGNNVLPARAGEVLLSYIVKQQEGIAISSSLAVTVLGRVFDGLFLLLLLTLSLFFLPFPVWVDQVLIIGLIGFGLAMAGLLWLVFGRADHHRKFRQLLHRILPNILESLLLKLAAIIKDFQQGIVALRQFKVVIVSVLLTSVIWLCEGFVYVLVGQAIGIHIEPWQWIFTLAIANLAASIPSGPASIGTFEGVLIVTLGLAGVSSHEAAAYALLLHVTQVLPITLLGAAAYAKLSFKPAIKSRPAQRG